LRSLVGISAGASIPDIVFYSSRAGFDEPPDLSQKQKPRKRRKKIQHLDGAGRDDEGSWSEIFLDYPPKLTCLSDGALPCSRSEILSADGSIFCNDVWLTSRFKVDHHEIGTRLGDNYVVAIHDDL
jgi:hypothetical protein